MYYAFFDWIFLCVSYYTFHAGAIFFPLLKSIFLLITVGNLDISQHDLMIIFSMKTDVLRLGQSREKDIYVSFCMHALYF